MRFAVTLLSFVLISSSVFGGNKQWPSDGETWVDELPRGYEALDIVVLEHGIRVTIRGGTAGFQTCVFPGRIAKKDLGPLMIQHIHFASSDFRAAPLTAVPEIPNLWVINDNCSAVPFYYKTDSVEVEFDRALPSGDYTIIYQSASLKHPNYKD